jgi:cobalt-zinc-cadmium efflux system outer membrane protein
MQRTRIVGAVLGHFLGMLGGWSQASLAETWTAQSVLEHALRRAPDSQIARTYIDDARARRSEAGAWLPRNPRWEGTFQLDGGGKRSEMEVAMPVELGYRRGKRLGVARAGVERITHEADASAGAAAARALSAYYGVLHAQSRLAIARDWESLTAELHRVAEERLRVGDVSRLDFRLAEVELARARAAVHSEAQVLSGSRRDFAAALGIPAPDTVEVAGDLEDRSLLEGILTDSVATERADVRAARSAWKEASARRSLARTEWIPELDLLWHRELEESGRVDRWGFEVTVPLFVHGQASRGEARAGMRRAQLALDATERVAAAEIQIAAERYTASLAGLGELEENGLPAAEEGEAMALEGYRAGKIDLPALLVIRRSVLETRREAADRLLEAAVNAVDLARARGMWP